MDGNTQSILVTGGAGFIGSILCRHLVEDRGRRVVIVDKLTYAASLAALGTIRKRPGVRFEQCDIAERERIGCLLREEKVGGVIHLAAETHVDRSIHSPGEFIATNVVGTFHLLETVRGYWSDLDEHAKAAFRFHLVSTDEVFGDADDESEGRVAETRYRPSSPYSATKAASDHLATAWQRTYGLPVVITNSTNTYGPWQHPDKLVPLMITNAIRQRPLPLYGTGTQLRDWLHVTDHVHGLALAFERGLPSRSYHFDGGQARTNLQIVEAICGLLDERRPRPAGKRHEELIAFVPDRPGHDRRYHLDAAPTRTELGWSPAVGLERGLIDTVDWYLENEVWWRALGELDPPACAQVAEDGIESSPERRQA